VRNLRTPGRSLRLLILATVLLSLVAGAASAAVPATRLKAQAGGEYIALGDSITAGNGASSSSKSYVQLYFGYLQSNGSGVTALLNLGKPGAGSKFLIDSQLPVALAVINSSTAVKAVTIGIGINDIPFAEPCADTSSAACPYAAKLRLILEKLSAALGSHDPGVRIQVMEYFNMAVGTPGESEMRVLLLGSDLKIDCAGKGEALGLNDLIQCVAVEEGAVTVDLLPVFAVGGAAYIAADGTHPNDAGHLAIAKAFGGAAEPTSPSTPSTPPSCSVPRVTGKVVAVARRMILRAHCAVGKVTYRRSNRARKGIVLAQGPKAGARLATGALVSLTVSRGRR
jgi:lysophospholipase L1-like esterase